MNQAFTKMGKISLVATALLVAACGQDTAQSTVQKEVPKSSEAAQVEYYGTLHPFAKEAVYFVMTDRFVDGDSTNNQEDQGGEFPTFGGEMLAEDGRKAYVGYLGGDLQGVVNNGQYIADMGFTAVWLTPILDNPDEAFSGGEEITFGGKFKDGGKTGYHGYWANNFWQIDEHYPSEELGYKEYTTKMRNEFGLKSVFDIVGNHGSPSFTMPNDQPKFGELYDLDGKLVADHQNLTPKNLDPSNPLHQFFHTEEDIMQLSNLNDLNPELRDYIIGSYLYWIEQGADAFRIDTIKHVPHRFWQEVAERIREKHPDFFMFGESFSYEANFIAQHTLPKNGNISVLDFPGQSAITKTFENPDSDYSELLDYLHLTHGPYHNPYELTTFYDNHDMARMNASDDGFIDANNWLFTSRGIPVVYQGSEIGFMRGSVEHEGNRNYLGQDNIELAKSHDIHKNLTRIANVRKALPALQMGLQANVAFTGQTAAFYRVFQANGVSQIALVLLNKGTNTEMFSINQYMQSGTWKEQLSGDEKVVSTSLDSQVESHSVQVWVLNENVTNKELAQELARLSEFK